MHAALDSGSVHVCDFAPVQLWRWDFVSLKGGRVRSRIRVARVCDVSDPRGMEARDFGLVLRDGMIVRISGAWLCEILQPYGVWGGGIGIRAVWQIWILDSCGGHV